jgi:hypothetical protein
VLKLQMPRVPKGEACAAAAKLLRPKRLKRSELTKRFRHSLL